MVSTIIFGAHLLPYGWLYRSQAYFVFSCVVPVLAFIVRLSVRLSFKPYILEPCIIIIDLVFCFTLML